MVRFGLMVTWRLYLKVRTQKFLKEGLFLIKNLQDSEIINIVMFLILFQIFYFMYLLSNLSIEHFFSYLIPIYT